MISKVYEKKLQEDLYRLAIMTLITTVVCIAMATYKALVKSEIKPDVKKQLLLLTPTLELDTIDSIKLRRTVPEENWESLGVLKPAATSSAGIAETKAPSPSPSTSAPKASVTPMVSASPATQLQASPGITNYEVAPEPSESPYVEGSLEGVPEASPGSEDY